ncbi:MAG: WYL domain-containing protein [Clostridia bacterium]
MESLNLCFKEQSWYLYAHCTLRDDFRFFKLRRIKNWALLDEHFDRNTPAKIFGKEKMFQDDFIAITPILSQEMAYRVYNEFLNCDFLPDGGFRVAFSIPRGDCVYHYLATFGEHCEIFESEDIRREVSDNLQKALTQYYKYYDTWNEI